MIKQTMKNQIPTATALMNPGCNQCSLSKLCIPIAVNSEDIDRLDEIISRGRVLERGERIFEQDAPFTSCYAVRSGAVKTYTLSSDGEEQVTGFYLPGEVIGLDSIHMNQYSGTATALERTRVCEIPLGQLDEIADEIPGLQHHFMHLMSQEIRDSRQLTLLLSKKTAEERIASLLLSLSSRFSRRRLSGTEFRLPMPRSDIGNFLGLAVETISRVLTRFQNQGLVKVRGRDVEILSLEGLKDLLSHETECKRSSA